MKESHLAIAGLLLPEVRGWKFSKQHGAILGKPRAGPGSLRILHVPQQSIPQPVTHEYCLSVMRMVLSVGDPTHREMKESVCGPYGAATFLRPIRRGRWQGENELIRAWYCRRPPGMIYGLYTCRESLAHGPEYKQSTTACALIMSGVLFDRVGWGVADDPLTQVLLNNFDRVEHEDDTR